MPQVTTAFHGKFILDTQRVLNAEILEAVKKLAPAPLVQTSFDVLQAYEADSPEATKGLYVLHYNDVPVYVGKTDESLVGRLYEHHWKLSGRQNVDMSRVGFRCLYFDSNWSALAHEKPLIAALACAWNNAGFGNHDTGTTRDGTILKKKHFDRLFPISHTIPSGLCAASQSVVDAAAGLKRKLPYLFRYEKIPSDCAALTIDVLATDTVEDVVSKLVDRLGAQWQVTFFYGYMIMYQRHDNYDDKSCYAWRRGGAAWTRF